MMAFIFLLVAFGIGWQLTSLLPLKLRRMEWAAFAVIIGLVTASWLAFLLSAIIGVTGGLWLSGLAMLAGIGLIYAKSSWRRITIVWLPFTRRMRWLSWAIASLSALIVGRCYWLSYNFVRPDGTWWTNGNVWGDGPVHITMAHQFAEGSRLDLTSHFFAGMKLNYPALFDMLSGMLHRLGLNWSLSFLAPTMLVLAAFLVLLFGFGWRLLGSARAAWLQYGMLLFSGSLHTAWVMTTALFSGGLSGLHDLFSRGYAWFAPDGWFNFLDSHLVPQRAFLLGMPLLLIAFYCLNDLYRSKQKAHDGRRLAAAIGLIGGAMPLVHTHSFVLLMGVYGLLALRWLKHHDKWLPLIVGLTVALSIPQFWWQMHGAFASDHFLARLHGWMLFSTNSGGSHNWFIYWLLSLGPLAVVLLVGGLWLYFYRRAPRALWLVYWASVSLFVINNLWRLQPSDWDNMKFFEYSFWGLMLILAWFLADLSRRRFGWLPAILTAAVMMWGGFLWLAIGAPRNNYQLFGSDEVIFAQKVTALVPPGGLVLTQGMPNNPVMALANRPVLMAYEGWSNLVDDRWPTILTDRRQMLSGNESTPQLVGKYGLIAAAINPRAWGDESANLYYFEQNYRLLARQGEWYLFDLKHPLSPF